MNNSNRFVLNDTLDQAINAGISSRELRDLQNMTNEGNEVFEGSDEITDELEGNIPEDLD